jgi:hypothetical protein
MRPHNQIIADYAKAIADGVLINGKPISIINDCYCVWSKNIALNEWWYMPIINIHPKNETKITTNLGVIIIDHDQNETTYIIDHAAAIRENLNQIAEDIKQHANITVSIEALTHNFNAWEHDYKSNFVDTENRINVFSPCGCNPLKFRLSEIREYDHTYTC